MFESIIVYGFLTVLTAVCGMIAYKRELSRKRYQVILDYALAHGKMDRETWREYAKKKLPFLTPEIVVIIAAFSLIWGMRYGVGVDFFHYVDDITSPDGREFEPAFDALIRMINALGLHYSFFFTMCAFVQITLILYTFRKYRFLYPYILIFFILGSHYLSLMNIIRQQVAACIFLSSVTFIDEKKPVKYYLCVFLAFLCHKSSLLLVLMYPILQYKKDWFRNVYWQLVLFAISIFLSKHYDLVVNMIMTPFSFVSSLMGFNNYTVGILTNEILNDRSQFGANTGFGLYANIIRYLPIVLYSSRMKRFYNSSFFDIMYTFWFIAVISGFIFESSIVLMRPFVFFMNLKFIMIGYFIHYCFKTKDATKMAIVSFVVLIYLMLCFNVLLHGDTNTSAYSFIWQH